MKKILYIVAAFIVMGIFAQSTYAIQCDQVFEGTYLRFDKTYRFYDNLTNGTNKNVYVNTREIRFMDNMSNSKVKVSSYLDPGSPFDWTQALKNSNYKVSPKQTIRIIETGNTKWRVDKKPSTRTNATKNNHDFMIYYKVGYDFSNNYPNASDDTQHVECEYYSVTYCGDGVVDAGYEVCDPNDPNKVGWGNGGCNATCEPITVTPPATCDNITATPSGGQAPFTTNIVCEGTNANSYKIQCGNSQVINSRTGTCSYSTGSNYQAQCIVNNNITSNACKQTIKVTNPNPGIRIDKFDANSNDIDNIQGNDTQTVAITNKAVFKIRVTNTGTENLKKLSVSDSIAPNCAGSVTLPNNKPNTWSNFKVAGSGNHTNSVLEPGEYYEYTCEKGNTQSKYDNEAVTRGTGVTSGKVVTDFDDTEVLIIKPSIQVVKLDANSNDRDGIQGNDTQTVKKGDAAVFSITVRNNGAENLKNIKLIDTIAGACDSNGSNVNLSGKKFTNKSGTVVNITFSGNGNHNDNIFQIGEAFSYTCEKGNSQTNYTNVVEVSGVGFDSNQSVNDDDDTVVKVADIPDVYDLALRKTTLTTGPIVAGQTVEFKIEVFNQGNVASGEVEIIDYIPQGLTLSDNSWTVSGENAIRTVSSIPAGQSKTIKITFKVDDTATGIIKNFAEISKDNGDDCDSTPDRTNGNGEGEQENKDLVDDQIGSGCEQGGDEDDHDIEIITIVEPAYDLALRKVLSSTGPFKKGDDVTFSIEVINQGTIDSGEVKITDYIPNGLTLNDTTWNPVSDSVTPGIINNYAERTISNLPAGERVFVLITFTIDNDAPKNINNFAEISSDSGDDCDSIPDRINGNGAGESTGLIDDAVGTACEPGGDEDDHDIAPITVEDGEDVVPSCDAISASPNSAQGSSLTTTLTCTGTAVNSYRIEVRDEAGNIVNTINAATGQVTLSRGASSTANFTAKCFVNNTITSNSCEQTLQITSGGSSSGGNPATCLDIIKTSDNTYQCVGNNNANSISMRCGTDADNNTVYLPTQPGVLGTDSRRTASFTCADAVPKCIVRKVPGAPTPINENNWVDSAACEYSAPICGDGVVDPTTETCDAGTNNGKPGFACTAQCTIPGGGSSSGGSSSGGSSSGGSSSGGSSSGGCNPLEKTCKITTTPTGGEIVFGPFGGTVVGHAKNILENIPQFPFIQNTSEYDYSFAELCVKKTSGDQSVFRADNEICVDMRNKMLYGYEKLFIAKHKDRNYFEAVSQGTLASGDYEYPDFVSNKDAIPSNRDYGEATLTTTIKDDIDRNGSLDNLYNAYFAAKLDVRVAKPSIATIGGGTSYVKNGSETTGDIKKVTDGMSEFDENTNFVGVSVGNDGVSSSVESNTDTQVIENTESNTDNYKEDVNDVTETTSSSVTTVSGFDKFSNFNGLDNVFILKGKNITLAELPASVDAPTTYIVEGGNLTLTKDIVTNENIAFVVKGGNITVKSDVEKLSGTYISIPVGNKGGKIISESSSKQLIVYGSLLGNLTELVSNRYYIEKTGGQLSVGTIVSFGSRLLSKPAPLVAQFKSEYNASQKVAR